MGPVPFGVQTAFVDGAQVHELNVMPAGGVSVNVAPATAATLARSALVTMTV